MKALLATLLISVTAQAHASTSDVVSCTTSKTTTQDGVTQTVSSKLEIKDDVSYVTLRVPGTSMTIAHPNILDVVSYVQGQARIVRAFEGYFFGFRRDDSSGRILVNVITGELKNGVAANVQTSTLDLLQTDKNGLGSSQEIAPGLTCERAPAK